LGTFYATVKIHRPWLERVVDPQGLYLLDMVSRFGWRLIGAFLTAGAVTAGVVVFLTLTLRMVNWAQGYAAQETPPALIVSSMPQRGGVR
jgi:hypothetical protein